MNEAKLDRGVLRETVAMYLLMGMYAVFTTIVGAILRRLIDEFALPMSKGGVFIAWQNIGCFVGIVLAGFVIDRFSKRTQIIFVYALFALLMIGVFFTGTASAFIVMLALAGLFAKIIDAVLNACIAEMHVVNKGFYMNLLHCSFGVGSFFGPVYAGFLAEHYGSWRLSYLILGFVCLALIAVYALIGRRPGAGSQSSAVVSKGAAIPFKTVLTPRIAVAWFILVFYCGHQIGMNNWLPSYFSETLGVDELTAGSGVSAFWLGLIFSRLSSSFLTRKYYEKHLLLVGNLTAGVLLIASILVGGKTVLFLGAFAAGLFAGATIPMVLTLAYTWYHGAQGKVSMILFIAITVGGIVIPWLMGVVQEFAGLKTAMILDGVSLLVSSGLILFLPRKEQ